MIRQRCQIRKGDSLTWLVRPGTLESGSIISSGWTCRAAVVGPNGVEAIAPFPVTHKTIGKDGEDYFMVHLTKAQTASLPLGINTLAIDVANDQLVPSYSQEGHVLVGVSEQLIQNT